LCFYCGYFKEIFGYDGVCDMDGIVSEYHKFRSVRKEYKNNFKQNMIYINLNCELYFWEIPLNSSYNIQEFFNSSIVHLTSVEFIQIWPKIESYL